MFQANARYKDGYQGWCRGCRNEAARKSHAKHRESRVEAMRVRRATADEQAKRKAYRERTYDTGVAVERNRRWAAANPDHKRALNSAGGARYRARKKEQFVEVVEPQIVWERDEGVCGICGEPADRGDWHLDHVVPISKGGEHSYANTQVSHPTCNRRKKDRLPSELGGVIA